MFPAITEAVKGFLARREESARPISLDLKSLGGAGGVSFDAVNVGWYARHGFQGLYSLLSNGLPAWSGEAVSVESALNHSVVWACNRLISESIGVIPAIMIQKKGGAKRVCDGQDGNPSHPMYSVMHDAPNEEITALGFSEMLTSHCLLQGGGFAKIMRRSGTGTAIGLDAIQPQMIFPDREKSGQKRLAYTVKDGNSADKTYTVERGKPHDILHIRGLGWDGIRGYSVIAMGRQSIGTAIAAERNVARFYANGGRLPYVLTMEGKFAKDSDFDKFRADWERIYAEPHRAPILEPPIKDYKQIGLSAKDSQLLETRLFDIHEICRWFLVSPHLVGDLSKATFCLPGDTEVYTAEGPRRIDQVRAGDSVWSRGDSGWVLSDVARSSCTGYDEILTIKTTNRTVRMNAKHRVLARVKRLAAVGSVAGSVGVGQHPVQWTTEWVPAGDLKVGDTIVNLKSLPDSGTDQLPSGRHATVGFMEFCGLLAGDGNITVVKGDPVGVQIARGAAAPYMDHYREIMRSMTMTRTEPDRSGENHPGAKLNLGTVKSIRERLTRESAVDIAADLGIHRSTVQKIGRGKLWGKTPGVHVKNQPSVLSEQDRQTRFRNVVVARELHMLGLGGTARTKRVPGWVFGLTAELRAAYVRGFLDADGSVDKKGRASFSSCNQEMLSQIRHLCMGIGVPVTNLRLQAGQTKLPNGRIAEFRQYTFTCSDPAENLRIGSHTPEYVRRMKTGKPFGRKERNYPRYGGGHFAEYGCELARISSIERSVIHEPVYDLEVSGTHSFIADGVVVHNSNVEHLGLEFVKMTLSTWITRWEQELWRCVLTDEEKAAGYYWKHNINTFLRGDFASRMSGYSTMLQNGIANLDEIRDLEDWNAIPGGGGQAHHIQLNMATVPGTGEPLTAGGPTAAANDLAAATE